MDYSNKKGFYQAGLFQIDFNINFKDRCFKSILNKMKTFLLYNATVGIHSVQGRQKVIRRYTTMSKKGKSISHKGGKSFPMTIIKLAYQNEFGADILIKPKTVTRTRTIHSETFRSASLRFSKKTTEKYKAFRNNNQQGYLLLDKRGKFVAYFKPNSVIHIPSRPFLRNVITKPTQTLQMNIVDILENTFVKSGYSASASFKRIAELVKQEVKNNIGKTAPMNNALTVKAKGHNTPLIDEQNRLSKAITFKLYKKGTKGFGQFNIERNIHSIDKALDTIKQFEQGAGIGKGIAGTMKDTYKVKPLVNLPLISGS